MFLIGHTAVGVLLAESFGANNPAAAFGVGWVSHYLMDAIPHGDETIGEWTKGKDRIRRLMMIECVDGSLIALAAGLFFWQHGFSWTFSAALIGACVPDVMWGLEAVFGREIFGPFCRFHERVHNMFKYRLPPAVGLTYQAIVTLFVWWTVIS